MRLTPEVFNAMDAARDDTLKLVCQLVSAGRYGLFPSVKPFELSVNISNNFLEVISLCCYAVTRSGMIIDIDFDSNYSHTFDTRVSIPTAGAQDGFLLIVRMLDGQWREVNDLLAENTYAFEVVGKNSRLDDNCLPIGLLTNELGLGWRLDEINFVPPCLYVSSHIKFEEQLEKAHRFAKDLFIGCISASDCMVKTLLASVCSAASAAFQRFDKEYETLTPAQLLSSVQQLVAAFLSGCILEESINLENQSQFVAYVQRPYDARTLFRDIEDGLSLWAEISAKMEKVFLITSPPSPPVAKPAPVPPPVRKPRSFIEI